jgi:hypothetical protein
MSQYQELISLSHLFLNLHTSLLRSYFQHIFSNDCITNSVATEPESSWPCSQGLPTGSYPEPTESTPHPPANLLWIHSDPILPSTPRSFLWSLSFALFHRNLVHFSLSQPCHLSHTPHSPCFFLPNDTCGRVQSMKLFIVQFPAFSCYFVLFTLAGLWFCIF